MFLCLKSLGMKISVYSKSNLVFLVQIKAESDTFSLAQW